MQPNPMQTAFINIRYISSAMSLMFTIILLFRKSLSVETYFKVFHFVSCNYDPLVTS